MATITLTPNSATIETKRLMIRSATPTMLNDYAELYADPEVMKTLADGTTKTREYVQGRLQAWNQRWLTGDFYSGLAVFTKEGTFIGHVVCGHGDEAGQSEMAYLFKKAVWGKGYGKEAVRAVVEQFIPKLVAREILREKYPLEGKPLRTICATARVDNVASNKIIQGLCMVHQKTDEKYGGPRHHYTYDVYSMNPEKNPVVPSLKKPLAECSLKEILHLTK